MKQKKIAVFAPSGYERLGSFIKAHINGLPFEIVSIHGAGWHRFYRNGRYTLPIARYPGELINKTMPVVSNKLLTSYLAGYLKKLGVDGVLAEYGPAGVAVMEACRLAGKPLFVHFHGFDAYKKEILKLYMDRYKRLFSYASGIVAVSEAMYRQLKELGAPEDRLHLNRYGVDPERFKGASPEHAPPVFTAIGYFVEKKAAPLTVLAFSRVVAKCPEAMLVMAGEGPLLGPARRMAEALGISDRVDFPGFQSAEGVSRLMRQSRVFVQHSLVAETGDSEGTPVAVIEAQMSGLPVVSTYHAGIPDVVVNEETGFLVPEAATDEMGDRMLQLALDPALAGKMGRAGRERALGHFTLERHLGELAQLIEDGIGKSN